jgi:hypothetical protein
MTSGESRLLVADVFRSWGAGDCESRRLVGFSVAVVTVFAHWHSRGTDTAVQFRRGKWIPV